MRIHVDQSKCAGHALCNAVDPELLPLDDRGYSVLESQDVTPDNEQIFRDAADACPEVALILR